MESKGYNINNKIASVVTPQLVSLANTPNFVVMSRKNDNIAGSFVTATIEVINTNIEIPKDTENVEKYITEQSTISFTESASSKVHIIKGTNNAQNINDSTYFISNDAQKSNNENQSITAENIKNCLIINDFINTNFEIKKGFEQNKDTGDYVITNKFALQSLGKGEKYAISFNEINKNRIAKIGTASGTSNNDSIDNGSGRASIELEVYTNTGSLLGENKFPTDSMGTYMTSLSKSYFGEPLWFNLNALMQNKSTFSNKFLTATNWCNAGTATDYRFVARRFDGVNREPFYLSDVLYNITGYNRSLEKKDLTKYVFDMQGKNEIQPLTNKLDMTHIKGQTQYFNFILSDISRVVNHGVGIIYRAYTQSKAFVAEEKTVSQGAKLAVVNTHKLNIDQFIDKYENVGFVEAYLNVGGQEMSKPLTFRVLPACLHKVNDFVFLNALGGWSSFNFGGEQKTDFKTSTNTIFKTQLPSDSISSDIESVFTKEVEEQLVIETIPVDMETVNWLKEMSSSIAVYELSTKRYVVVEDMKIKPNTKDELFKVEMKYHYSDSYNGLI